jgi:hypothetical protein
MAFSLVSPRRSLASEMGDGSSPFATAAFAVSTAAARQWCSLLRRSKCSPTRKAIHSERLRTDFARTRSFRCSNEVSLRKCTYQVKVIQPTSLERARIAVQ